MKSTSFIKMTHSGNILLLILILISLFAIIGGCLSSSSPKQIDQPDGLYVIGDQNVRLENGVQLDDYVRNILHRYQTQPTDYSPVNITYPYEGSVFPPEIAAPTVTWSDVRGDVDRWLILLEFGRGQKPVYIVCARPQWMPEKILWEWIKSNSIQALMHITVLGVHHERRFEIVSKGSTHISTSPDPAGAQIMYRLVPPIFSYALKNLHLVQWVLADISEYGRPDIIMSDQKICGSCHTFSKDGRTFGMDMDYKKDKGAYFLTTVRPQIHLNEKDFISWNDFPKTDGRPSSGLFSRISPDGRHVISTVDEILFLISIDDLYCSQLFYPLRGRLAYYSRQENKIRSLRGADLPSYVQTDPCWSPDGQYVIFSRVAMNHKLIKQLGQSTIFPSRGLYIETLNRRYPVQFNVYRIPFNNGKGGRAEPLAGASHNGKSNYYPRYSPDGKWIVFTQSETGLAIQPDSKLYIMPSRGGSAKKMRCNLNNVNSWHTWSPNSRWLAFVSKETSPYTQIYLTHIDPEGNDSPPVLLDRFNRPDYAVNVPEFVNIPRGGIQRIDFESQ